MQYAVAGVTPYDPVTGRYGGVMAYGEDIQAYNPYAFFDSRNPKQTRQQLNGSIYLDWNVFKGFTAHVDYALSFSNYFQKRADTQPELLMIFRRERILDVTMLPTTWVSATIILPITKLS